MIKSLKELEKHIAPDNKCTIAVAGAQDEHVLCAIDMVCEKGFAKPILIGNKAEIAAIALKIGMTVGRMEIMDEPSNTG